MTADTLSLPPHNLEAEQAVLGAILLDPSTLTVLAQSLRGQDFYSGRHQRIYESMHLIVDRGEALDNITLAAELDRVGYLAEIGGRGYLAELLTAVGSSANVRHHGTLTRQSKVLRDLRTLGMTLTRKVQEGQDSAPDIAGWAEQELYKAAHGQATEGFESVAKVMGRSVEYVNQASQHPSHLTGLPTGFDALDRLLSGWQLTDLIIVGARPSMGKTSLALNTSVAVAKAGHGVGIFSLEMSKQQLGLRLLSAESGIDSHVLRTGQLSQSAWMPLANAAGAIEALPLWVDDTADLNLTMLRAKARRLKAQHNIQLIVVDYLQLMQGGDGTENRQQEVSAISRGLKLMAKELGVAVIALSQLNRGLENRVEKRPQLSDLRESGSIEQDADVVCLLYREEVYTRETPDAGIAEVLVKKQRNGPIGDVRLGWVAHTASFGDL